MPTATESAFDDADQFGIFLQDSKASDKKGGLDPTSMLPRSNASGA